MSLMTAYDSTYAQMKPQIQGTCGIYSFWYATILLHHLNATKYPDVPFPRACHNAGGKTGLSLRKVAKRTSGSAQGELLSVAEMLALIGTTKYRATVYSRWNHILGGREDFLTEHLAANRPVVFAYICGNGPVTKATATGVAQDAYGPHWSLLIGEEPDHYIYVNPHAQRADIGGRTILIPTLTKATKKAVLDSNDRVDDVRYDKSWVKHASHDLTRGAKADPLKPILRTYDLGAADRQSLNNVLIAVG
jgi:hypothetical protein